MEQSEDMSPAIIMAMTDIVAAHLGNTNTSVPTADVPAFIRDVYAAIREIAPQAAAEPAHRVQPPAVPVDQSVFPDHIVCLEDGRKLKMLRRHLMTNYHMTPAQYRAKWGLPGDYPLVAPDYAKKRADVARETGLGRRIVPRSATPASAPEPPAPDTAAPAATQAAPRTEPDQAEPDEATPAKPAPKPSRRAAARTASAPAKPRPARKAPSRGKAKSS